MATNFHTDLPNDQIHSPKDFSIANNSSVMTKDINGNLDWETSLFNLQTVMSCESDVSGALHNRSFVIYHTETDIVECHIAVTGETGTFTPTPGYTQSTITIAANDTNITVAAAIKTALDASPGGFSFTTSVDGAGKVTFSGMSNSKDTVDISTGFGIVNTKTYTGKQVLYANSSGEISWKEASTVVTAAQTMSPHFHWEAVFINKSISGNNDWHIIEYKDFNSKTHRGNLGTSTPTSLLPNQALNASVFVANKPISIRTFNVAFAGTIAGETVTLMLFKATPATGTGAWTLTAIDTLSETLSGLEVMFETGTSGGTLAVGEILIPIIKVNTTTSGALMYQAWIDMDYI